MPTTSGWALSCSSRLFYAIFQNGCGALGKVIFALVMDTGLSISFVRLLAGGLMQTIVLGINCGLKSCEERTVKKRILIDYLLAHFKQHNMYVLRYYFCEFLCLINVIGQLYLMNWFVGGEFFSYGLKGLLLSSSNIYIITVVPKNYVNY